MAAAVASAWNTEALAPRRSSTTVSSQSSTCAAASNATVSHQQQQQRKSSRSSHAADTHDRFYGHRDLAELCERVILALFACPLDSTSSSVGAQGSKAAPRLAEFIAYALHRTRLPLAVTHQALFLLKRLKSRFPAARGSSGHRLFISALMLASKSSCDDTYSNKSWTIVGQGLFSLREVNQMERELFGYLGFRVNVEPEELDEFVIGLEQGRIHAPVEPISPEMGSTEQFEQQQSRTEAVAPNCQTQSQHLTPSAASVSPSTASEPCFGSSSGPHRSVRSRTHQPPAGGAAFNSRASIAGYPSMSSHPMVSSASVPMVSSTSDSSYNPSGYQHQHARASTYPAPQSNLCVPGAPVAAYYPGSPSSVSLASSRGSLSYGSTLSAYSSQATSPYASGGSSSNGTTPATPASEFASSPQHCWSSAAESIDGEHPAGTYDSEHSMYSGKRFPFANPDPFSSASQSSRKHAAVPAPYGHPHVAMRRNHQPESWSS